MTDLPPPARAPLLVLGFVSLVIGVAGGLVRLNAGVPAPGPGVAWHGALMASAFFGTLIALERAVAIGKVWAYAAPAACGLGGIAISAGSQTAGLWLLASGGALFGAASLEIWRRQRALHTAVLALGALCLLAANLWLAFAQAPARAVPFWVAFFVLTIGGERLELSRLAPVPRAARAAFGALAVALAVSAAIADLRLLGIVLVAIAAWLARYDLAVRTVHSTGITRYIALCLLTGYLWLALGGVLFALGAARDSALHSILLGFVFSMVFGHAPVIFPAVLRIALPYHASFYAPLAVLHASVLLRFAADLADHSSLRAAGGVGNALAIVFFILTAAALALTARR
ncbi:MAG: hypothetical protein HYX46_09355 [Betaproteobacteria bacterium]|nr:hypothetical protein [Betaproteobacteria bacterium]